MSDSPNTIESRNRAFVWGLILAAVVALAALFLAGGCVGAPKNVQQFEEMDEADFQSWLTRVSAWSELAASQVVAAHPESQAKILEFATLVESLATSDDPLGEAASQAGLGSPIASVLVLEAKALLGARGALPSGRAVEFTRAVARGVRHGVASPTPIIGAECEGDHCFKVQAHG